MISDVQHRLKTLKPGQPGPQSLSPAQPIVGLGVVVVNWEASVDEDSECH
jgi:hypothetical protein